MAWVLGLAIAAGPGVSLVARAAADREPLADREAELLRQYLDLERSFLRLADLLAATDPRRAGVLRDAFQQAREEEVGDRLGRIVALLEQGQLLKAGASQEGALEQFRTLLSLLEKGEGDQNLADTKLEVRAFLARIAKLIARQQDIEGSTEAGGDEANLAARQRQAADEASSLAGELGRFAKSLDDPAPPAAGGEGVEQPTTEADAQAAAGDRGEREPADGNTADPEAPSEDAPFAEGDDEAARARRTKQRLQAAERRMRSARENLEAAQRDEAQSEQERALEELETARAELEEILRQLREEEVERLLVNLETRIRTMLRIERGVLTAAEKLGAAEPLSTRERQIEAARIGREQEEITAELMRAAALVRDDGSAVAIPEAVAQIQDDSVQAAGRFARGDLGATTLGIVGDIIGGLEELLAALEKSRPEEDAGEQAGAGGGRPAEPDEQPLVDKLAELRMLRSLQVRINTRTERFAQLLENSTEQAAEPALLEALGRLAERQRAIERATRDIVLGRTE